MKKLFAIFLMVTYMAGAIGFSYSLHYCGGHFRHVSFSSDTEKGCCGHGKHKKNCCKDKVVKAKNSDDQSFKVKTTVGKVFFFHVYKPTNCELVQRTFCECTNFVESSDSSPPFVRSIPIYLQNRVLRI